MLYNVYGRHRHSSIDRQFYPSFYVTPLMLRFRSNEDARRCAQLKIGSDMHSTTAIVSISVYFDLHLYNFVQLIYLLAQMQHGHRWYGWRSQSLLFCNVPFNSSLLFCVIKRFLVLLLLLLLLLLFVYAMTKFLGKMVFNEASQHILVCGISDALMQNGCNLSYVCICVCRKTWIGWFWKIG